MVRLKYILLIFSVTFFMGCEDTLQDLNTNPEILEGTQPEYLFAGATNNFMSPNRHHLTDRFGGVMTFMQYLVRIGGSDGGAYIAQNKKEGATPGLYYFWNDYFNSTGRNFRQLMQLIDNHSRKDDYQGLRAIALLLEIQQAWICVDLYGAMPYNEALKAIMEGGTQTPKYDFGWDLYKQFDKTVSEQVTILESLTTNGTKQTDISKYDYFYKGDLQKWAKFGNSLRVKMALRYEHRDPDFLREVVADVAKGTTGVMASNEDGCWYRHPKDFNDNIDDINSISRVYETTEAFVNTLKYTQDPRLYIMVRRNYYEPGYRDYDDLLENAPDSLVKYNPDGERYLGMPACPYAVNNGKGEYGKRIKETVSVTRRAADGSDITRTVRLISQLQGRLFVKNGGYKSGESDPLETWVDNQSIKLRTCVLSYADVCFTMAEIAEKYGLTQLGSAEDWYKKGVESSIDMYVSLAEGAKVPDTEIQKCRDGIDSYLASAVIQYTGSQTEKLEKIYSQAWINYLKHPEEAYAMWKRTGYPKFKEWTPGETVTVGYLDKLYGADAKNEASLLLIPRRQSIPQRDENYVNWDAAIKGQMEKDAAYGETKDDCRGRIWWDNAGTIK